MTHLAVAFTLYLCPGTFTFLGFQIPLAKLPASAKPALAVAGVCQAQPALELFDPARADAARARVLVLGHPAQLYKVEDAAVVGPPLVEWKTVPAFKETP